MNIVEAIQKEAIFFSGKTAFIDRQRKITYAELLQEAVNFSVTLKDIGVISGSRVALLCEDSIEYVIASLAVLRLSAAIVPVPVSSSPEEVESLLKEVAVNFLLKINPGQPVKRWKVFCRKPKAKPPREFFHLNPAFIRFTSGTTGASKGVIISHDAILKRTEAVDKGLRICRDDTVLWVLGMSFHFVATILLFLRRGATVILAGNSFPDGLLKAVSLYRPTFIYASPLHYHLLAHMGSVRSKDLSAVRMAISTAVELPFETAKIFKNKFGFELSQAYGIIEAGLPFINTSAAISKRCSVGRILPDFRLKLANKDQKGIGEIWLKGPGFFSAYFSPWKNAKDILRQGWFNTGDIGRVDKDGYLFILGRTKNVINFSGMKIFPSEVESVLMRYPQIQEALVYADPHSVYGNVPVADVVLKKEASQAFDEQALRSFCYRYLAKYKVPKKFNLVTRLKKTASGKVER